MNTPNHKMHKKPWQKPHAYILRGSAAGGGEHKPGFGEVLKGSSTNESQKVQAQLSAS